MLKRIGALCLTLALAAAAPAQMSPTPPAPAVAQQAPPGRWLVLLHGGAGAIDRGSIPPEKDKAYRGALDLAVQAAARVLNANGTAVAAVEASLRTLEDDPLFAEPRTYGLSASIMDGSTAKSGSVVGVKTTKNPISLAKAALYKVPGGELLDDKADPFALKLGLAQFTSPASTGVSLGSLGMVVRDRSGNLAAGTTTEGTQGREGSGARDLPLLAAQTYASNRSCAVASTGSGSAFLKLEVAHSICALVQYTGMDLQQAEDEVIQHQLTALKGEGGVVAITADGQLGWSFNTQGMFRARLVEGGAEQIGIYKNEP